MTVDPVHPENLQLYDTTLRDGGQQEGIQFSVADKLKIAELVDSLGVGFIEGGWPGSNPVDTEFFARAASLELRNARLVAFGSTRRAGRRAGDDPQLRALCEAGTEWVCVVAKAHDMHVTQALHTTLDENLAMVTETVEYLIGEGKKVIVDAEHYFDGFRSNPAYALEVIRDAAEAGAQTVVLCDTNGGMLPSWMGDIVSSSASIGVELGVHCHNDSGCAVANSLAALEAGASQVQGTINGYGERTGNMDLTTLIADVQLKYGWPVVTPEQLGMLTQVSRTVAEIANQPAQLRQPFVGESAFAHKAGLHASALKVNDGLYQHVQPAAVGNDMRMLISEMAGRANIQIKGEQLGLDLSDRELAGRVADAVKQREARGYAYEAADASFELLVRRMAGTGDDAPFEVISWRVFTEQGVMPADDPDHSVAASEATVKLAAKGTRQLYVGEGNGPVNALDQALSRALSPVYPQVRQFELTDYRVRILDRGHGTDATVRVQIDTTCEEITWTTVGVGENVIEASWEALTEAYLFGLTKRYGLAR
ncbi:2-isopropylmalate synthase [Propionibacterium cyclohexanicum]|uniref:Citramalate synthase n=1 Tax=Propionibacterium cyclohexanicum TaxID=64702 RepID=A0A1H9QSL2_9ACTN|nr:citramalate synthase [Propionibacterium cyclohexanicum]SER63452.1 2-isopropylmalate synthase [Propionibacterium cyclohexanicum]